MPVLLDTNILLRLLQPHHPHCLSAERALNSLRDASETLHITSQNLIELWAVMTRTVDENGLGFTVEQAAGELEAIKGLFVLLPDVPLFEEWERLVKTYGVLGKNTHDARLVAAMRMHKIARILTFNTKDFSRYENLTVVDPAGLQI